MSTTTDKQATRARAGRRYRFTDDEFDRMTREGILRPDARAFLWNGEIIQTMAEDQPHLGLVYNLLLLLAARLPRTEWAINMNQSVQIRKGYRPQPDLTVLRGPRSYWGVRGRVPTPGDVALLIEVSDATYAFDAGRKLAEYARANISQYWIMNAKASRVEVYMNPEPGEARYRDCITYGPDQLVPLALQAAAEGDVLSFEAVSVREILAEVGA
jgi:hypothetical protein